jgi:hypothetical protein
MNENESKRTLDEMERIWRARFVEQPKLPSSALLMGAVAMALGFGAVLFLLTAKLRPYAWIWIALSVAAGLLNRYYARRWYERDVLPWSEERKALKAEIEAARAGKTD